MLFWALSAACGFALAGLAVLLWLRRPPAPLWPLLFACQIFALLWVVGDLWATNAVGLTRKEVALAVLFTGSIGLTAAWWESNRRYLVWLGLSRGWLEGRLAIWLPAGGAAAAWLLAVTNGWHGQLLVPVIGGRNGYEWGAAVVNSAAWALIVATSAVCAVAARRHESRTVRNRLTFLSVITLVPVSTHLMRFVSTGFPREDTVAIGLLLTSAAVYYGIRYRGLFNIPPVPLTDLFRDREGMLFLDRGGRLLTWNREAEKLLESVLLEPEMPLLDVLVGRLLDADGEHKIGTSADLLDVLTEDHGSSPVFRYEGGGGERWLRLSAIPVPRRGPLTAVALRLEDATRETQSAREDAGATTDSADSSDGKLALLAGGVGHDFNNLLTVIEGRAQIAIEDAGRGLPVRRHIVQIRKAAKLARDLNAELLNYAGRALARVVPLDLSAVVDEVEDLLWELVPSSVEIRTELDRTLPAIAGDHTQLRQVVMNLVKNGAEAIGEEIGVVRIRTASETLDSETLHSKRLGERLRPGEHVLLEVVDSGCGMSAAGRRRAFDSFYSTKATGRGLGLAVVAGIVETHCGAIELDSQPDWGTTFRIWLPISPGDAVAPRSD